MLLIIITKPFKKDNMQTINIDFRRIGSINDFYKILGNQITLPEYFGNNLDALWDVLSTEMVTPLIIQFEHLSLQQLEKFEDLITLFEDASIEMNDTIQFEYFIDNNYN